MAKKILITGASGLIGARLTDMLGARGHSVAHLVRAKKGSGLPSYEWDPVIGKIDIGFLNQIDTIVHLSGAGVADGRWTSARKKEILDSRVNSTTLLFNTLKNNPHTVQTFVSASAIGYYGFGDDTKIFKESDNEGKDFLANVTRQWENEVDQINTLGLRVIKLRIGVVLSEKGGALKKMAAPFKFGLGAALGTGHQFVSWIHIDDLCAMFIKAIEDERMSGAYNATTAWCTNEEMTAAIAKALHKVRWLPPVPSVILKLVLGEMADIVLGGSKISSEKIRQTGFHYQFPDLESVLLNLTEKL
jgi:uncharacterized protein (TIGR01777 family)